VDDTSRLEAWVDRQGALERAHEQPRNRQEHD
jgi:hypothetical protein